MGSTPSRRLVSAAPVVALASLLAAPLAPAAPPVEGQAKAAAAETSTAARVWARTQDLAIFALGLIGVDYRFGGTSPDAGLDCSGLIRYVFQHVTGVTLPRTSRELSHLGNQVSIADLRVGDLVFFNTRRLPYSHVGIYLGDDRFVHAPGRGGTVEVVSMASSYWRTRFSGARRLPVVASASATQSAVVAPGRAEATPETEPSLGDRSN